MEPTGVNPGKPTWFSINASEAGKGDVHVRVEPVGESKSVFRCKEVALLLDLHSASPPQFILQVLKRQRNDLQQQDQQAF